jgi:hypothetical protein
MEVGGSFARISHFSGFQKPFCPHRDANFNPTEEVLKCLLSAQVIENLMVRSFVLNSSLVLTCNFSYQQARAFNVGEPAIDRPERREQQGRVGITAGGHSRGLLEEASLTRHTTQTGILTRLHLREQPRWEGGTPGKTPAQHPLPSLTQPPYWL